MKINYITEQELQELMKIYETRKQFTAKQLSCFILEVNKDDSISYLAIDNRSGDMWTEEFCTLGLCIDYFNGEDLNKLLEINDEFLKFSNVVK